MNKRPSRTKKRRDYSSTLDSRIRRNPDYLKDIIIFANIKTDVLTDFYKGLLRVPQIIVLHPWLIANIIITSQLFYFKKEKKKEEAKNVQKIKGECRISLVFFLPFTLMNYNTKVFDWSYRIEYHRRFFKAR